MLVTSIFSFFHSVFRIFSSLQSLKVGIVWKVISSLQHRIFFDLSKLKAFAADKINVREKLKFVLGGTENIVGKGENYVYQHFLLFPQCFPKLSSVRSLKLGIMS